MNFNFQEGEIILIDKDVDWTSFDAVNKLKKTLFYLDSSFKKIKIGHCGTLDPFATGLLLICTGKFTKKISEFQNASKIYSGVMEFGKTTPSLDPETEFDDIEYQISHLDSEKIINGTKKFIGKIWQIPPIYSALKLNGKRFCDHKRSANSNDSFLNEEILKKKREVEIFDFQIKKINMPFVYFEVHCSKGTYIRSLANDFAISLGSGAYLKELRRLKIGEFDVDNAFDINDFCNQIQDSQKKEI